MKTKIKDFFIKKLDINGDAIRCRFGFYNLHNIQAELDSLIIMTKLLEGSVTSFSAANNTGMFLIIDSQNISVHFNFFMSFNSISSVHISTDGNDYFYPIGEGKLICKALRQMQRDL